VIDRVVEEISQGAREQHRLSAGEVRRGRVERDVDGEGLLLPLGAGLGAGGRVAQ